MIPTSIDGTDITGATIDGTDVQEITVDGDVVFSARELPVAFSNLVAWWPFDSSFYGGANTDDATGGDTASGDSTSYDTVQNGTITFQSSGGAKDINTGDASGYAEFDDNEFLDAETTDLTDFTDNSQPFTYTAWVKFDNLFNQVYKTIMGDDLEKTSLFHWESGFNRGINFNVGTGNSRSGVYSNSNLSNSEWFQVAGTHDGNSAQNVYIDGNQETNDSETFPRSFGTTDFRIGELRTQFANPPIEAAPNIDDVRVYNKELSASEVSQIFTNTKPSSKP
jgi:hypothetical protein